MNGLISIIVPVFKTEGYLSTCLDSLLNQTYRLLEVIAVDDGSPDNCGKICDDYAAKDTRIKVIHQKNKGVSSARNAGMNEATGDWVMFVDSDDSLVPSACEQALKAVCDTEADVAAFYWYRTGEAPSEERVENRVILNRKVDFEEIQKIIISSAYGFNGQRLAREASAFFSPVGKLIACDKLSKCKFPVGVKRAEDNVFNLALLECVKKVCLMDARLYCYNTRADSAENSIVDYMSYCVAAYRCFKQFIDTYHPDDFDFYNAYYTGLCVNVADVAWGTLETQKDLSGLKRKRKRLKALFNEEEFRTALSAYKPLTARQKWKVMMVKNDCYFLLWAVLRLRDAFKKDLMKRL